jgi:hypothetical protein
MSYFYRFYSIWKTAVKLIKVFGMENIFTFWLAISEIIKAKTPAFSL